MEDDDLDASQGAAVLAIASTWKATLFMGVVTLILGIIVTIHPGGSLNVVAVLLGVLAIISGIFQLVRIFDRAEQHRVWLGVSGFVFIVVGVVLIRHLHLTVALIGLLVGITWIVQGIAALIGAFTGAREGAVWWGVFGAISLIAGIVVTASPVNSVTVLATLLGIWFIVMGLMEMIGAFLIRRALSQAQSQAPSSGTPESAAREAGRSA
jgi:uncharacterized membrane protein HdeD (DUF308 family)